MTASSDRIAVQKALADRRAALLTADDNALAALLAEDLTHIHSTGRRDDKPGLIKHVNAMGGFIAIEPDEPVIGIEGDIAVVTGRTVNTVRSRETGKSIRLDGFSTLVWRRDGDAWLLMLSQLTPFRNSH